MNMAMAVQAGSFLLFSSAFYVFRAGFVRTRTRIRRRHLRRFVKLSTETDPEIKQMMQAAGIPFRLRAFQLGRLSILTISLLFTLPAGLVRTALLITLVTLAIAPRMTLFSLRSPFALGLSFLARRRKKQMMREIYLSAVLMKNLGLSRKPPSALALLEHLKRYARQLAPVYARMISLWSVGRQEEAVDAMRQAVEARGAEVFIQLLLKIEHLEPEELLPTMRLFQERFILERETVRMNKNRFQKTVVLALVAIPATCVFMNFIVVGVAIDLLKQLSTIG